MVMNSGLGKKMVVCQVCGNDIPGSSATCRFCGARQEENNVGGTREFNHETVNLEKGRPVAEVALRRMESAIEEAVKNKVNIITFIHGYGSSGRGGVIRSECRKSLFFYKEKGLIRDVIAGEDFSKRSGPVKFLLHRYPQLVNDRNLNRNNRGITLVVIS
jgi:hypothetical protein